MWTVRKISNNKNKNKTGLHLMFWLEWRISNDLLFQRQGSCRRRGNRVTNLAGSKTDRHLFTSGSLRTWWGKEIRATKLSYHGFYEPDFSGRRPENDLPTKDSLGKSNLEELISKQTTNSLSLSNDIVPTVCGQRFQRRNHLETTG